MTAIISSCDDHSSIKSKTFIAFSKMISLSNPTFPFRGPRGGGSHWLWFSAPAFVPAAPHVHYLTRELSAIPGIRYCHTGMLVLDYTSTFFSFSNTVIFGAEENINSPFFMWLLACWPPPLTARVSLHLN